MLQGPEAEEPDLPADRQLRTFRQGHLHLGAAVNLRITIKHHTRWPLLQSNAKTAVFWGVRWQKRRNFAHLRLMQPFLFARYGLG